MKDYIYIVTFNKGKQRTLAFLSLDNLRIYLVYGWDLEFNVENVKVPKTNREIVYNENQITIEAIRRANG